MVGHKVLPLVWQEVANNLGGAMTGEDHPCDNRPIVLGSFIQHLARLGLSTSPILLKARVKMLNKQRCSSWNQQCSMFEILMYLNTHNEN